MPPQNPATTTKPRLEPHPKRKSTPGPVGNWPLASRILDMQRLAVKLSHDPNTKPSDLWTLLQSFDPTSTVRNRLDRKEVESTPRAMWELFLSLYIAACITAMARKIGVLITLERSGLVVLPENHFTKDNDGARQKTSIPDVTGYTGIMRSLSPVESEIPDLNGAFLGMLQSRLKTELAKSGLLALTDDDKKNPDKRIREACNQFSGKRLFRITQKVTEKYLRGVHKDEEPDLVNIIVSNGTPYVFLWLKSTGLLDEIVDGLLRGKPLMRTTGEHDNDGNSVFVPTGEGTRAGLYGVEHEER
jgi:hypothetical protein